MPDEAKKKKATKKRTSKASAAKSELHEIIMQCVRDMPTRDKAEALLAAL